MAVQPFKAPPKAGPARPYDDSPEERELRELCQRKVTAAERDQNRHRRRINDCYKHALPWRHLIGAGESATDHIDDLYDSTAMTVLEDFAADMLNTFTPKKADWVDIVPVEKLDEGDLNQLAEPLQKYKKVLFDEIRRSNLDAALQEAYLDLGPGTMTLVIQDRHPSEPIHCQAWPLTDVLLERDPWGGIGGIWRSKMRLNIDDVPTLWPNAKKLEQSDYTTTTGPEHQCEITDGAYRDWSDRGTEKWIYVVFTPGRLLWKTEYTGAGSSLFTAARWSRDSKTAWGVGPTYRELPNIKTLNHVRYLVLKNLDKNVDPAVSFENDGVINPDHGVGPGDWIPREIGSEAPAVIEPKNRFEVGFISADDLVSAIKRAHYQDEPEQVGKTPPTAEQWADQAARKARRMGTPATNLVHDLQYPIINRFAYLLAKRGALPKIELNGREIALKPDSPLLRAQEMEEVVRVDHAMTLLTKWFGPQLVNAWVKQDEAAAWLFDKTGTPRPLLRGKAEMQQMLATLAQLGQQAGMLPGHGGGAPAAAA